MDEMNRLWQKRCADNFRMQLRYWNLIIRNSGLMFFIYAMILIGGFYYKQWLDSLPGQFPGALAVSAVLAAAGAHAPARTFIRPADLVFLLPAEAELSGYFRKSRVYSFLIQSVGLFVLWIIGAPLCFHASGFSNAAFLTGTVALLAAKAWAIDCSWQEQFIDGRLPFRILRYVLSFCLIYFVLSGRPFYVSVVSAGVMLFVSVCLFHRQASGALLRWQRVLESDERQMMLFLRFANLFTDVPRLRRTTRPRWLLSRFFPVRRFEAGSVFSQIFIKTFLRADDYLPLYVRLTVIGALLGYFLNLGIFSVFIVLATVYLTGLQLLSLWNHPYPPALAGLYPLEASLKRSAYVQLVAGLLIVQAIVVGTATGAGTRSAVALLVCIGSGLALALFFSFVYSGRRIEAGDK